MINDLPNLESLRREKPSMDRSPLTGEQGAVIPDYSTSITSIGASHQILTESIENGQRQRTEMAYAVLLTAVNDLGRWLNAKDFHV